MALLDSHLARCVSNLVIKTLALFTVHAENDFVSLTIFDHYALRWPRLSANFLLVYKNGTEFISTLFYSLWSVMKQRTICSEWSMQKVQLEYCFKLLCKLFRQLQKPLGGQHILERPSTLGSREFSTHGPTTWNILPSKLRDPSVLSRSFCSQYRIGLQGVSKK